MIGIFDSGSGGLTVLKEIRARLPRADIVYFGDIENAPYGVRSLDDLTTLTIQAIQRLQERGATHIVSACNSVSAALALSLSNGDVQAIRPIEMVGPTVHAFKDGDERILLTATPATIASGMYQNGFIMAGKKITTIAIPKLAGAIEFGSGEVEIEKIIRDAFAVVSTKDFDTLVLGCTHYPLVRDVFERIVPALQLFDPAVAVAGVVASQMNDEGSGITRFLISKDSAPFRARVASLFPQYAYRIEVLPSHAQGVV